MRRRWIVLCLLAIAVFAAAPDLLAQGCSMCKAVAGTEPSGNVYGGTQAVGAGLNKGILFLMGIPYILLFLFFRKHISGFVKEFRNAKG